MLYPENGNYDHNPKGTDKVEMLSEGVGGEGGGRGDLDGEDM